MGKYIKGQWHPTRKYETAPYVEKYYCKRKYNRYTDADGNAINATMLRYSDGLRKRPRVDAESGKPYYEPYASATYYADGLIYEVKRTHSKDSHGDVKRGYYLAPFTGHLTDAHPKQTSKQGLDALELQCVDGRPIMAAAEGYGTVWTSNEPIDTLLLYMAII